MSLRLNIFSSYKLCRLWLGFLMFSTSFLANAAELTKLSWKADSEKCLKQSEPEACIRQVIRDFNVIEKIDLSKFQSPKKERPKSEHMNDLIFTLMMGRSEGLKRALGMEKILRDYCLSGNLYSCWYYNLVATKSTNFNFSEKAHKTLVSSCENKNGFSCLMASLDELSSKDDQQNRRILKQGCDASEPAACGQLASEYSRTQEFQKALTFYNRGCYELGDENVCYDLANFKVERKEFTAAQTVFKKLCETKNKNACFSLGQIEETTGYHKAACEAHQKGCDLGSSNACMMAMVCDLDRSNPDSMKTKELFVRVTHLLNEDCTKGNESACEKLEKVAMLKKKYSGMINLKN